MFYYNAQHSIDYIAFSYDITCLQINSFFRQTLLLHAPRLMSANHKCAPLPVNGFKSKSDINVIE